MLFYNRITRSLCAVFLSISLILSQTTFAAEGEEQAVEQTNYKYSITLEYGNLAFYYDYGVWNVNTMRYEASSTSSNPAVGTESWDNGVGCPGWYGFDGVANKIVVENLGVGQVAFSLDLRSLTEGEQEGAGVSDIGAVSGVTMIVTDDGGNILSDMAVDSEEEAAWYIHLQGKPVLESGEAYSEITMNPIGMLTIKIVDWDGKS